MKILILISKSSWANDYKKEIKTNFKKFTSNIKILHDHKDIKGNYDICIIFSYFKILPKNYLNKSNYNLIVHESNLPKGRGMSPLTWQIINNKSEIVFSLFEAGPKIDDGKIYFKSKVFFKKDLLFDEIKRKQLSESLKLLNKFFIFFKRNKKPPKSISQKGKSTYYKKRKKEDSKLNINQSIKSQFNLLRSCDNKNYPAYFKFNGKTFILKIIKK